VSRQTRSGILLLAGAILVAAVIIGFLSRGSTDLGGAVVRPTPTRQEPKRAERKRPRLPVMPSVLGQTPDQAREELDPLGIQTRFVGRCEGVPPRGRVVLQSHEPGRRVDQPVAIFTDAMAACSDERAPRPCDPHELGFRVVGDEPDLAGSAGLRTVWFWLRNRGKTACQVEATARVALEGEGGQDASFRGNPSSVALDWKLRPGGLVAQEWLWKNWCHGRGRWTVSISVAGMEETDGVGSPACFDRRDEAVMYGITSQDAPT
jgi:archaellum component FlaG (FlaF/FlaG flagellin family)